MKKTLCILLLLIPFVALLGQSISPDFEFKNPQLQKDVYRADYGTKGLLLTFDYLYRNSKSHSSPIVPRVTLAKNGMKVYLDETKLLVLSNNSWSKAAFFVPYREIDLLNGLHKGVQLNFSLEGLLEYSVRLDYQQPLRYMVEIDLKGGGIKEQLEQYDESSNPKEWLPDVYYLFTTNGGTQAVYRSVIYSNSYKLLPKKLSFYLLEGEQLKWSFYDRDGEKDQHLGTYTKINPKGEYTDKVYGQMFGRVKNLEFDYVQRAQARQAISIYSDANYKYKEKNGVAVTIEYDLAKAYQGKKAWIHLNCYDENGIQLDVPVLYPVEGTPDIETTVDLKVKGKLKYFIPFYVWKEASKNIEFYFELEETKEQIQAARHTLHQSIHFDDWVIDAEMKVEENFVYKGAKGLRLHLSYELMSIYENAPLYVKFYNANGDALPFPIYYITGSDLYTTVTKEHVTKNPRISDNLFYFIPYASLTDEIIAVQMDLVPDVEMNILQAYTKKLSNRSSGKANLLELASAGGRFRLDNYGQVVELKLEIPAFFVNKVKLKLNVQKNGRRTQEYLIDGMLNDVKGDFVLKEDSGRVYVIFPHRNIESGTRWSLSASVINMEGKPMGEAIRWEWKAPNELFNRRVKLALKACKFDQKMIQNTSTDATFPWSYVVEAGGSVLVKKPLSKYLDAKTLKEEFTQNVLVNREDNITIKLVHAQNKKTVVLWHGDLGKWEQNNFKADLNNKHPIKILKVAAIVDKNYKENRTF